MIKKCQKGFTLIEVVISMSIMGMVMMVIYSMFFTNYKTMNTVNTGVELQSQGESAMNYLVDAAISAKAINSIKDKNGEVLQLNTSDNKEITEISFTTVKFNKTDGTVDDDFINKMILQANSNNAISLTEGLYKMYRVEENPAGDKNIFISSFISSIKVKPFGINLTGPVILDDIKGIEFTITLQKMNSGRVGDLMTKTITNKVKFRN